MENEKEIDEVKDEIDAALKDPRGLLAHQKRLAFCLSAGIIDVLENYLAEKGVLKKGVKVDHRWFKKKREDVRNILNDKTIGDLDNLKHLDKILDVAFEIESKRNDLIYGKEASEKLLNDLIDKYLNISRGLNGER